MPISEEWILDEFQRRVDKLLAPLKVQSQVRVQTRKAYSWAGPDGGADLRIRVRLPSGKRIQVAVQVRTQVTPQVAKTYARLREVAKSRGDYLLFVAPYISETTAGIIRASGAGYVDLSGNALIEIDGVAIDRRGRENRYPGDRKVKSLFARKSSRVMRILLESPQKPWILVDMAAEANVSIALVQKLRDALNASGFLDFEDSEGKERRRGRARPVRLTDPAGLLNAWKEAYDPGPNRFKRYYSLEKKRERLLERLAGLKGQGALTGFTAATLEAPYVRSDRFEAYVSSPEGAAEELSLRPAESGANVFLASLEDAFIMQRARKIQGLKVVSPILVFLDLSIIPGRGSEQADFYREKVLGY